MTNTPAVLSLNNVGLSYAYGMSKTVILEDISFSLAQGDRSPSKGEFSPAQGEFSPLASPAPLDLAFAVSRAIPMTSNDTWNQIATAFFLIGHAHLQACGMTQCVSRRQRGLNAPAPGEIYS